MAEQCASGQNFNSDCTRDACFNRSEEEENWVLEGTMTAKEVATFGVRGKLREMKCVCKDGNNAVPTTAVEVIELTREIAAIKRQNATLSDRSTNMKVALVETSATGSTMRCQLKAAELHIAGLKTQLTKAQLTLQTLVEDRSRTKADFCAQVVVVE